MEQDGGGTVQERRRVGRRVGRDRVARGIALGREVAAAVARILHRRTSVQLRRPPHHHLPIHSCAHPHSHVCKAQQGICLGVGGMRETSEGQAELLRHVASARGGGQKEESERHPQRTAAAVHLDPTQADLTKRASHHSFFLDLFSCRQ
jgi:hypothetical protein